MKKILIIADGILAKHFLERVMAHKGSENHYTVITYRPKTLPKTEKIPENFTFLDFDPTSETKLSMVVHKEFAQIMILVSKEVDAVASYRNIRKINPKVQIVLMDRWGLDLEDENLMPIDSREVLSSRFADYLPNMPVIAQNVGLGSGEIMEIQVPIGSAYVYRHVASIQQKKWRIVAIYRNNSLILARPTLMIQPNDVMLAIGDPNVLMNVFKSVKQEIGQFPSPFGNNIYCIVDMQQMEEREMANIVNDALLLHSKINNKKLHVRVLSPKPNAVLEKIKSLPNQHINVTIDYFNTAPSSVLLKDIGSWDVGLLVTSSAYFKAYKTLFYRAKIPVFKIGQWGFSSLKTGVILASDSEEIEKESSVILDFSSQLDLDVHLHYYDPEKKSQRSSLVEHFENLSKLFDKEVTVIQEEETNPILRLQKRQDVLQFVPFHEKIIHRSWSALFSTDLEQLSHRLDKSYQLFIPTSS
jgi:hypothetical protein